MALIYMPSASNLLARGRNRNSDTANSYYPLAGLYDGRQDIPFAFSALGTTSVGVVFENNLIANGGGESWTGGVPDSWDTTGTVSQEVTEVYAGSNSFALDAGTGNTIIQLVKVRPGERLKLSAYMKKESNTDAAGIIIINSDTGNYLATGGGSWQGSPTAAATHATTSWAEKTITFQVEDYDVIPAPWTYLMIQFASPPAATDLTYVDEVVLMPAADWWSIHCHNINPNVDVVIRYSDSDTTTTGGAVQTTLPHRRDVMGYYESGGPTYARYWKLHLSGDRVVSGVDEAQYQGRVSPIYIGEWVIGQAHSLSQVQKHDWSVRSRYEQLRSVTRSGAARALNLTTGPGRVLGLRHFFESASVFSEFREKVWRWSGGGEDPAVWQPNSDDSSVILMGRQDSSWDVKKVLYTSGLDYSEADTQIAEEGYPAAWGNYLPAPTS